MNYKESQFLIVGIVISVVLLNLQQLISSVAFIFVPQSCVIQSVISWRTELFIAMTVRNSNPTKMIFIFAI
jgi:hypothetical protein